MPVDGHPAVEEHVRTAVAETLPAVDWTLAETDAGYRITLSDRELDITRRDGPAETIHWIITLRADGETVGKFGPSESTAELVDQLETVLMSDVFYTVCCDG